MSFGMPWVLDTDGAKLVQSELLDREAELDDGQRTRDGDNSARTGNQRHIEEEKILTSQKSFALSNMSENSECVSI